MVKILNSELVFEEYFIFLKTLETFYKYKNIMQCVPIKKQMFASYLRNSKDSKKKTD